MQQSKKVGHLGEVLASRFLRDNGYEILAANFAVHYSEIDIIACKDNIYVFVEVKSRSGETLFPPADAVDRKKQENIKNGAAAYLSGKKKKNQARFDIIEVIFMNEEHKINHIENAF